MLRDISVVLIMYFAALAWGSNEAWAMAVITMTAIGVWTGTVLTDLWRGQIALKRPGFYLPLLLFIGYGLLQLSRSPVGRGSDPINPGAINEATLWMPFSVEAHSTASYLALVLGYFAVIYVVHHGFRRKEHLQYLLIAVLALGVFEALYGLVQFIGNHHYIWDFRTEGDYARGTFINRNHYALLLNFTICTGVGFLYYRSARILTQHRFSFRQAISSPVVGQLLWGLLWIALMGLALLFSLSRMGMVAMLASIIAMATLSYFASRGRRTAAIGFSLLFVVCSLAVYTGIDVVVARLELLTPEYLERDRLPIWRDAFLLFRESPIFGHGLGTFRWTYPVFETFQPDVPARYAHNDYLQALTEVGIVGLGLLVWAFISCLKVATQNLVRGKDALVRGIGLGTLGVLTATALQEWTDFSLYIPGVALTFAVLVGLNLRASELTDPPASC